MVGAMIGRWPEKLRAISVLNQSNIAWIDALNGIAESRVGGIRLQVPAVLIHDIISTSHTLLEIIVTSNSVAHISNVIDLSALLAVPVNEFLKSLSSAKALERK